MNLLIAPFHDWRKILKEGYRTRDAHFIEALKNHHSITQIILNRPTTLFEIFLKRKNNFIKGDVILSKGGFKLYRVESQLYIIDYIAPGILGQVFKGHNWFVDQYSNAKYIAFINACLKKLEIHQDYYVLNQNIFASKLSKSLNPIKSIFDAWDDFTKFEVYKKYKNQIVKAYQDYARTCDFWITNSSDNVSFFSSEFQPKNIYLITNAVDLEKFTSYENYTVPEDVKEIPRPIVGFGGKITHLIDVDLLNATIKKTPGVSFVFVGQILDKQIFNAIEKASNFYYLGDKHYDEYPNYVKTFDICVVPYVVDESKKSGANSIKAYEYLATNKKVVGTNSNGLENLSDHLYIVHNADEFSKELMDTRNLKPPVSLSAHSWDSKVEQLINCIKGV